MYLLMGFDFVDNSWNNVDKIEIETGNQERRTT